MKRLLVWICILCNLFFATIAHAEPFSFIDGEMFEFEIGQYSVDVPKAWEMTEDDEYNCSFSGKEISETGGQGYGYLSVTLCNDVVTDIFVEQVVVASFQDFCSDFSFERIVIGDSEGTIWDCLREDGIPFTGVWVNNGSSILMLLYTDFTTDAEAIHEKAKEFAATIEMRQSSDLSYDDEHTSVPESSYDDVTESTADYSEINVRFDKNYIKDDEMHLKVFVQNTSDKIFSGDVYVTFYTNASKKLGSDLIIVDELLPGRESWANVVIDAYSGTPNMSVDFLNASFETVEVSSAGIDSDATKKTKDSFYWNYDGVSWYSDITEITVYTDGSCIVTVKNPKESGQFYAATVWSCGNDYGVTSVQVVDSNGKLLAMYQK